MRQYLGSIYWYNTRHQLSMGCYSKVWDPKTLQAGSGCGPGIDRIQRSGEKECGVRGLRYRGRVHSGGRLKVHLNLISTTKQLYDLWQVTDFSVCQFSHLIVLPITIQVQQIHVFCLHPFTDFLLTELQLCRPLLPSFKGGVLIGLSQSGHIHGDCYQGQA